MKEVTEVHVCIAKFIASIHDLQRERRLDEEDENNDNS